MKLTNPTDDQLNRCFAEKVAGYYVKEEFPGTDFPFTAWQGERHLSHHRWATAAGPLEYIEPFTQSADAVLPWLEKWRIEPNWHPQYKTWAVIIRPTIFHPENTLNHLGEAPTFPKAGVIALLRANGVEIEFTQPTP